MCGVPQSARRAELRHAYRQAFAADEIVGVNAGEHWISIDRHANYDETPGRRAGSRGGLPGLHRDVQTYLKERIEEVLTGASEPILVRVFGDDLTVLREQAQRVKKILDDVPGTEDPHVSLEVEVPQVTVTVDLAAAQKYGLKPGDVRRAAATLVAGEEVGDVFRDGRAYDVQVWSTPATRSSVTSIEDLPIDTPGGQRGPVGRRRRRQTAGDAEPDRPHQRVPPGGSGILPGQGCRHGGRRRQLQDRLADLELPAGYSVQLLGEFTERQAATNRLMVFALAALALILLLLQTSFRSWRLAFLSLLTLPIALVGGVMAAYIPAGSCRWDRWSGSSR